MRELPILFSTPMVQAIMEGRKTMTRRTAGLEKVNENPDEFKIMNLFYMPDGTTGMVQFDHKGLGFVYGKPRYQVGDKLWVRETFRYVHHYAISDKLIEYKAGGDNCVFQLEDPEQFIPEGNWKPSIFMPKEAARLWLEVTEVRCERLWDITEADAIAEGVEKKPYDLYVDYLKPKEFVVHAEVSFFRLWEKINGRENTLLSPWLFVYTFKKIEKP